MSRERDTAVFAFTVPIEEFNELGVFREHLLGDYNIPERSTAAAAAGIQDTSTARYEMVHTPI